MNALLRMRKPVKGDRARGPRRNRPAALRAADVMSAPVASIGHKSTVKEFADLLRRLRISGVLVVGAKGRPIGVATIADLAAYISGLPAPAERPGGLYYYIYPTLGNGEEQWGAVERRLFHRIPVTRIMSPAVIRIPHTAPLEAVARVLCSRRIHRVFVERRKKIVGVVSSLDILKEMVAGARGKRWIAS